MSGMRTRSPPAPPGEPPAGRRPRAHTVQVTQAGQAGVAEAVQFQQPIEQESVVLVTQLEGAGPGAGQVERHGRGMAGAGTILGAVLRLRGRADEAPRTAE